MSRLLAAIICFPLVACNGNADTTSPVASPDSSGGISISDIQGDGIASPLEGKTVVVEGVVTGDVQVSDSDVGSDLGGFFIQAESPDSNTSTSDGIFVFDGNGPTIDVAIGDRVSVVGSVNEYFGETQVAATSVTVLGVGEAQPITVTLPAAGVVDNSDGQPIADLERYEGMLVRFEQTLTVTELYGLERFGEVSLSEGGRLFIFANGFSPDVDAYAAHLAANAARTIVLDDGQRGQNEVPVRYLHAAGSPDEPVRAGSTVAGGLTGVLRYSRGSGRNGTETWRVMPTVDPVLRADNPRPGAPDIDGELRIASFNARNFFSTIDSGQDVCGPAKRSNCRGADSQEELARQLSKTTTALSMIDADIVGLIELENNASESLESIVNSLNATMGADSYSFVDAGMIGPDAIKNGFIYKPATVTPSGPHTIITSQIDERFVDGRNRPTLAQTFVQISDGAKLTIVINHLKSKRSSCERDGDQTISDGQSNCNQTRTAAVRAIADWLKTDPTASNDPDFLIIGDLNADIKEDPLRAFADAGYINLLEESQDAASYSYIFRAQSGALDHALVSKSLLPQVAESIEWHINADEAPIHNYNLENGRDAAVFDGASPYRTSDHDPIVIGLDLRN